VGSFDGFVRAVCDMDMVGFAFGSSHPTAPDTEKGQGR
jgi:hypothetical protein